MRGIVLRSIILFFSLLCEYTLLPVFPSPLKHLSFLWLSFVFFSFYETDLFLLWAISAGLARDIMSSGRFGIYTFTFFILACLSLNIFKGMIKDNLGIKLLYTFFTVFLGLLMVQFWEGFFPEVNPAYVLDIGYLMRKGFINSICFPLWSVLFLRMEKWISTV
ncbi:MAG: hypothetical protein NC898_04520 [Candidatus Omnitrophica bacterium]|nr:hypothetical protein [Candidatus Omnitrophota bacterium]MCM8793711.1 hypothetical protein [Candidatus Omnitrophota bacterium]